MDRLFLESILLHVNRLARALDGRLAVIVSLLLAAFLPGACGSDISPSRPAPSATAMAGGSAGSAGTATAGVSDMTGGTASAVGGTGAMAGSAATGGTAVAGGAGVAGAETAGGGVGGAPAGGASPGGAGAGGDATSGMAGFPSAGMPPAAGAPPAGGDGFYRMERLDRGLIAIPADGGIYLGWRLLGFEYDPESPDSISFKVYRDGSLVANVTDSTNYLDTDGTESSEYAVTAVVGGTEQAASETVTPWTDNYLSIPLESPGNGYSANDGSAADLDGDGRYEIVLKWDPNNAQDNSNSGVTGNVYLDGLTLEGERLWRIDLGPNIRAGAHYTQFIVFDYDGDGRAELAVKTAPGTRDGSGEYLSLGPAAADDDNAVYRNSSGYVLDGPEYLTVFDGLSGAELATVDFDVPRGSVSAWGDDYGNRVDRFLATAAYLDDTGLPSFVMARGYYTRTTLTAWNFRNGELSQLWKFDSNEAGNSWTGQGSHSLSVANVDADPQQEIIYGAMTVDHDGQGLCNTSLNHGDALHVSDFLPSRPGLEVFMPHEYEARPAWSLRDAATCEVLQQGPITDDDIGRGVAGDVFAGNEGAEMWASNGVPFMSAATGQTVGSGNPASVNFLIWWDADEIRELEDGTSITKYGVAQPLLSCSQCASNNGTKSTPALVADLFGDWREEVIWRQSNNSALRLYSTTDVTTRRIYTLMHDAQYRVAISWQNVAYNQPPHPSFYIGSGMAAPPRPDIVVP